MKLNRKNESNGSMHVTCFRIMGGWGCSEATEGVFESFFIAEPLIIPTVNEYRQQRKTNASPTHADIGKIYHPL